MEGGVYRNVFIRPDLEFARWSATTPSSRAAADRGRGRLPGRLAPGSKVLVNRSPGIIVGSGTRSRPGRVSLSSRRTCSRWTALPDAARCGPSVAIPVPVTDAAVRNSNLARAAALPAAQLRRPTGRWPNI
jgi:hypothetical protein